MVTWHPVPNELAGLIVKAENISFTLNEYTLALTLSADNFIVLIDTSGGNVTVTLPAAADHKNRIYTIKNVGAGSVTIDANSLEKIDGELTVVLNLQFAYVTIVCDGDEWFIIGGEYVKIEDILRQILNAIKDIRELAQQTKEEVEEVNK